jgi:hypothetical protein
MLKFDSKTGQERRAAPRLRMSRGAKVYSPLTRRYYAARTIDMSRGGAMVSITSPRTLIAGDKLDIAIAWDDRCLIPQATMVKAEVARVVGRIGEHQAVGIRFTDEIALAAAA